MITKKLLIALRFAGIGWYIGICIALGIGLGIWLDRKVHLSPLFTFLGLGVGLVAAFWGVYHMLLPTLKGKNNNGGE